MLALMLTGGASAGRAAAQDLADFDYVNLSFRGLGLETGYIWPTRVEPTSTFGIRMDLGYLGPGVRIVPGITYWSSRMQLDEVRELELRVEDLIDAQSPPGTPPASVSLGRVDWSDLVLTLDGHVVWSVANGVLTYLGVGLGAHIMNGDGDAVANTFVEDLLDSVTAGANVHGGFEYPVSERFRIYGLSRLEVMGDLQYLELRIGGQFMIGDPLPDEER